MFSFKKMRNSNCMQNKRADDQTKSDQKKSIKMKSKDSSDDLKPKEAIDVNYNDKNLNKFSSATRTASVIANEGYQSRRHEYSYSAEPYINYYLA